MAIKVTNKRCYGCTWKAAYMTRWAEGAKSSHEGPTQGSQPPKRVRWTMRGSWRNREGMFLPQCVKQCDTIFLTHWGETGILCWVQWSICNDKFQSWKRNLPGNSNFPFFGRPCHMACGIIVPWPGMESKPLALVAWNFNHWPTGEVLLIFHS